MSLIARYIGRSVFCLLFSFPLSVNAELSKDMQAQIDALSSQAKTQPQEAYEQTLALYESSLPSDWELRHALVNAMAYQLLILSELEKAKVLLNEWLDDLPPSYEAYQSRAQEILGIIHYRTGDMITARKLLNRALAIAERYNQTERIITININTAIFLQSLGLNEQAHELFLDAVDSAKGKELSDHLHAVLRNNIAASLVRLERYEEAVVFMQQSLLDPRFREDDIAYVNRHLTTAYLELEQFDQALLTAKDALNFYVERGDFYYQGDASVQLGRVLLQKKQYSRAKKVFEQALKAAEKAKSHQILADAHYYMSVLADELGNTKEALNQLQAHLTLFKQFHRESATEKLINFRNQLDQVQQKKEISELENQLKINQLNSEHKRNQTIAVGIVLLLITLFVFVLYRLQRKKRQQAEQFTEQLQESYQTLQRTQRELVNSEKMASLGRMVAGIAHEFNTPLGIMKTANSFFLTQLDMLNRTMSEKPSPVSNFIRCAMS